MNTNRGVLWCLVHVLTVLSLVVAMVPASVGAAGLAPASPPAQATPPELPPSAGWSPLDWQQLVAATRSVRDRLAVPASETPSAETSDASTLSPTDVQGAKPAAWAAELPVAEPQLSPTPSPGEDETIITPEAGGVLQSANGRVRLEFPPGAVAQRTVVRHSPVPPEASTPPELFYLCDLTATTEGSGTPLTTFARPITFTVSYGPADSARRPGAALTLYWFDPAAGRWVPLPSQVSAQVIMATTSHFTLFAAGASGPGYGTDVLPTLRGFASDLWTGAATLQLPFTLPPGPAGFDLGLSLGYNSQGINELVQSAGQGSPSQYVAQGSWTGLGWSLGGLGQISRPLNSDDKLYLGFAGGTFEIKNLGSGNWTTEPQVFLRLQHNGDERSTNPWLAWTPDGTQYTFGNPAGTVGNGTAYTAYWTDWQTNCSMRAYQWALTGITDTHGNRWQMAYEHEYKDVSSANGCGGDAGKYIRATYPTTITLTPAGAASPTVRVRLVRESRPDFAIDKYNDPYVQNLWGLYRLKQVFVEVYNGGAWQQARRYDLAYSVPTLHSLLTAVTTYGVDATALVTATFTYGGQYNFTRLASASNGYSGVVTYGYDKDFVANNAGCTSYEWQVVGNRQTADGLGNVFTTTYGYVGAYAWVDPVGCPEVPRSSYEFLGHTTVTETVKEKDGSVASVSVHRYHQRLDNGSPDPRKGKAYLVSTFPAVGSPALAQTASHWVTETVSSSNFVHLSVVTQTTDSQAAVTKYYYDADHQGGTQYGNLTRLAEYGAGASAYRTTERWFYPRNDASGYLVTKVGEEKIKDSASACQAQRRYFYDGNASHTSPPSKGDLTKLSRIPSVCDGTTLDIRYGYDTWGNQTVITNALGYTTTTQYDASFRTYPLTVTNALGQRTLAQYDYRFGQPTVVTDTNNIPTTYVYDSFGRLTAEVRVGDTTANPTVRYYYYAFGTPGLQQITIGRREYSGQTDYWGHWESHLFNGLGQIVQVHTEIDDTLAQNNESRVTRFYNSRGLVESELAPYPGTHSENGGYGTYGYVPPSSSLSRTRYAYDALGRVSVLTDTAGITSTQSYSGWTTTAVDGNRHQKLLENDAFGRLSAVKEYTGTAPAATLYATTTYGYDVLGNLRRVTDTLGSSTVITYNALGWKTSMSDPDMGTWGYAYDNLGNLITQTNALGQNVVFAYDKLNRLTKKVAGSSVVTYTYDVGSTYGIGQRTIMTDTSGVTRWWYDARGRLSTETRTIDSTPYTTTYAYDTMDRLTALTYPGGEVVSYTYNPQALLKTVIGSSSYITNTTYNVRGQMTRIDYGNNVTTTYAYWGDVTGEPVNFRLKSLLTSGSLQDLRYRYDAVGNVLAITDTGQTTNFVYDPLDRLTGASGAYSASFDYNAIGNLLRKTEGGITYNLAYTLTRPIHAPGAVNGQAYTYDQDGNLAARPGQSLTYNAENQLTQVVSGTLTTTFTYDGDGKRVKQTVAPTTTVFIGNYGEIAISGTQRITTTYYYANGQRIALRTTAGVTYIHSDHLRSTSATSGAQSGNIKYFPYGATRSGAVGTAYKFTGQRLDDSTGLYYYGARYYDAALGRFIQPDTFIQTDAKNPTPYLPLVVSYASPKTLEQWNQLQRARLQPGAQSPDTPSVFDPQFLNRYSYTRNNPLAYVDDSGNIAWWIVGGIIGGVAGFGAYAITHRDNFSWGEAALWTAGGAVVGATFGAGAQWVAGALGTQAAATAATTAGAAAAPRGLSAFSRAAEFGIRSYNELAKLTAHTGLRAHHLIEERFAKSLGLNAGKIPSIALTPQEHQMFTNLWRQYIGYEGMKSSITTSTATLEDIWIAAQKIYQQYPELLEAVRQALGK